MSVNHPWEWALGGACFPAEAAALRLSAPTLRASTWSPGHLVPTSSLPRVGLSGGPLINMGAPYLGDIVVPTCGHVSVGDRSPPCVSTAAQPRVAACSELGVAPVQPPTCVRPHPDTTRVLEQVT